jgi:hypothetical protein
MKVPSVLELSYLGVSDRHGTFLQIFIVGVLRRNQHESGSGKVTAVGNNNHQMLKLFSNTEAPFCE